MNVFQIIIIISHTNIGILVHAKQWKHVWFQNPLKFKKSRITWNNGIKKLRNSIKHQFIIIVPKKKKKKKHSQVKTIKEIKL